MECGKLSELQQMTPKEIFERINEREREFTVTSEIVRKHRETSECKMVWMARGGDQLKEDVLEARSLPELKEKIDVFDENPERFQGPMLASLFAGAEDVGRAKSLAYFRAMQPVKEHLLKLAFQDERDGTTTKITWDMHKSWLDMLPPLRE